MVIVDYCRYGNLQSYLKKHRNNFIHRPSVTIELGTKSHPSADVEFDGLFEWYPHITTHIYLKH
jgi:hypothetical protein